MPNRLLYNTYNPHTTWGSLSWKHAPERGDVIFSFLSSFFVAPSFLHSYQAFSFLPTYLWDLVFSHPNLFRAYLHNFSIEPSYGFCVFFAASLQNLALIFPSDEEEEPTSLGRKRKARTHVEKFEAQ